MLLALGSDEDDEEGIFLGWVGANIDRMVDDTGHCPL